MNDTKNSQLSFIIRSHPSIKTMIIQRISHLLYESGDTIYSRELQEQIHSLTGIYIHPGTSIGHHFCIINGVGIVIEEYVKIGNWCILFENVTIGISNYECENKKDNNKTKLNELSYTFIGNTVCIHSGCIILEKSKIGNNVSIESNCWINETIHSHQKVFINSHPLLEFKVHNSNEYKLQ